MRPLAQMAGKPRGRRPPPPPKRGPYRVLEPALSVVLPTLLLKLAKHPHCSQGQGAAGRGRLGCLLGLGTVSRQHNNFPNTVLSLARSVQLVATPSCRLSKPHSPGAALLHRARLPTDKSNRWRINRPDRRKRNTRRCPTIAVHVVLVWFGPVRPAGGQALLCAVLPKVRAPRERLSVAAGGGEGGAMTGLVSARGLSVGEKGAEPAAAPAGWPGSGTLHHRQLCHCPA